MVLSRIRIIKTNSNLLILSSCISTIKSFSFSTQTVCSPDDECTNFLPWLEHKAGKKISSALSIGKSPYGRSLFATKFVQPGDSLLKVPYNVQIAPDNLIPDVGSVLPDEVCDVARLALVIVAERRKGQHSEWAPYINCLPEDGVMHNTIFWSKNELEMIRISSVYQETLEKNAQIMKAFSAIKPALDQFPEIFVGVTFEEFQHAYAVVESRAWRSMKMVSLIPFADFVNHDGLSDTVVLSDENEELSEVVTDRVYVPGDQVCISYGKYSNATLVLDFGFTLSHNTHDEVKIQVNIPHNYPLRKEKLNLLHTHHTQVTKEGKHLCSSLDMFTIKEVRSMKGKGRGIPQALRAYCRVLCSTSSKELRDMAKEAMDNDGRLARYPMKNKCREIEAHQFLLSSLDQLIEGYNGSIELLEPFCMFEQRNGKRKMALDLLSGELRVLKSAIEWLKSYCAELSKC